MCAEFIKGRGQPRLIRSGGLSQDRFGLATATAEWWAFLEKDLLQVTSTGKAHPNFSQLKCERIITSANGGGYSLIASYAGIFNQPVPIIELDMGTMEAPIDTHPDFAEFAGTSDATKRNGAVFTKVAVGDGNTAEVFDQFGPTAPLGFRGVRGYLIPTAIVRRTSISTSYPSVSGLGEIGAPPNTFGISGTWLKTGASSEKRGDVFVTREEWKNGGRLGWNTTIYS
jgi:hypothetical protein